MPCRIRWPLVLPLLLAGCPSTPTPPAAGSATTLPAGPQRFVDATLGIALEYPAGWRPEPAPAGPDVPSLHVVAPLTRGDAELTLTVPKLPFHIPGMIPITLVASGYADDVRKRMPDATGPAAASVAIPGAQARRVTLTGHEQGSPTVTIEDALLIVHADRVYVLAVDSDPAGRPAAAAALDGATASIRWTR